jgi:hypothetical protein
VIVVAVDHRKVDDWYPSTTRSSSTSPRCDQAADQGCRRGAVRCQGQGVNTLVRKGKVKRFRGFIGKQKDVKKAVVTLEEGQTIDVSTGPLR